MPQGSASQFAIELARIASDLKGDDLVVFDLRGLSSVTDFTVICTCASPRQMRGVADQVLEYGRKVGEKPFGLCGYDLDSWLIVDFVDVVLHIFTRSYREYYDLELLWGDAPKLDWARSETA